MPLMGGDSGDYGGASSFTAGFGLLGAGLAGFGAFESMSDSKAITADSIAMNEQKRLQMEYDSMRSMRDIANHLQLQHATALSNATESGAQFGSGLAGGIAQGTSQAGQQTNAVWQNEQIGERLFDLENKKARDEAKKSKDQGIFSMGSSILGAAGSLGKLAPLLFL